MNLDRLREIKDNWDGRGSVAPTEAALRTAENIAVCPLGSGGVQVELHAGGVDVEIEVDAMGNVTSVYWARARH